MAEFKSERHRRLFDAVVSELPALGYDGNLVIQDYEFTDWFLPCELRRSPCLLPRSASGLPTLSDRLHRRCRPERKVAGRT